MTWFDMLTGFDETTPDEVRRQISVDGETMTSRANGKVMACGQLEMPSLGELRERVRSIRGVGGRLSVREVVGDVRELHRDADNAGSLFQVASQFNLLEMVSPNVTPERGVGIYENDRTQGPACAIACGAGTIYRNYFAPVNGEVGQSKDNQIDCLADLGRELGNADDRLWRMRNGYALASTDGLNEISGRIRASSEDEIDHLRGLLRIGVQWNTQVTLRGCDHKVTQAYCSAFPVAYSYHPPSLWEDFARLVLQASYEATICAAVLNGQITGNNRVFLTLLGGGAFGNETNWIIDAIRRILTLYKDWNIEAAIVSYSGSNAAVQNLAEQFSG